MLRYFTCFLLFFNYSIITDPKMASSVLKIWTAFIIMLSFLSWQSVTDAQKSSSKDIPSLKLSKFAGPTLTFLFWWVLRHISLPMMAHNGFALSFLHFIPTFHSIAWVSIFGILCNLAVSLRTDWYSATYTIIFGDRLLPPKIILPVITPSGHNNIS